MLFRAIIMQLVRVDASESLQLSRISVGDVEGKAMDPLSEVLSLLRLRDYVSGGFILPRSGGFDFGAHNGVKCYAITSGACWLLIENEAIALTSGDCILLPKGMPFALVGHPKNSRVNFSPNVVIESARHGAVTQQDTCYIVGTHFQLEEGFASMFLGSLPLVVHARSSIDSESMRWALHRMREEYVNPQPGSSLIGRQLAHMVFVQALRLHLRQEVEHGTGWLFGLADTQMLNAISAIHEKPGFSWTVQSLADRSIMSRTVFAERFHRKVGTTPMQYLTRWRMLIASERLERSEESVSSIGLSLGYETESAFGRTFRKMWGCSPREHRRSRRNQAQVHREQRSPQIDLPRP